MNSRTKLLCVFFLMTICLSFSTLLGAFAETVPEDTPSPVTAVTENTSSKGNSVPSGTAVSSRANSSAALSSRASSAPPKSSASSKKKRRRRKVSSAPVSSAVSEVDVFGVLSSAGTSDSDVISLPEVDSIPERDPLSSAAARPGDMQQAKLVGILSWVCIGLGILVVLIVVLSNGRPPRGPGRKRYRRPKRSRKKHLLNDRYYRNLNRY